MIEVHSKQGSVKRSYKKSDCHRQPLATYMISVAKPCFREIATENSARTSPYPLFSFFMDRSELFDG